MSVAVERTSIQVRRLSLMSRLSFEVRCWGTGPTAIVVVVALANGVWHAHSPLLH